MPDDLPQEILDLLGGWEKTKGRQDRSAHLHRLIARLVRMGYSDGEVMAVALLDEQAQDKWEDEDDLRREIQRSIEKIRSNDEIEQQICSVRRRFLESYTPGRTLATDRKLMDALIKIARQAHQIVFDASIRRLAGMAGLSTPTVQEALRRLIRAGYVRRLRPRRSRNQSNSRNAYRYKLKTPQDISDTNEHRGGGYIDSEYVSTLSTLDPSHDVWRHQGLACCRPTYEELLNGITDTTELESITGKTCRTVKRHLEKLTTYGLADQKPNGQWVAFERSLDDVAKELGTFGTGDRQSDQFKLDRAAFAAYLDHQKSSEEQQIQELLDLGYKWGGPNNAVLMHPDP